MTDLFYPELRRLAARMKGERSQHTWQPTALVHELYLEPVKVRAFGTSGANAAEERAAFLRLEAPMMRRMLVHHARPLYRRVPHVDAEETVLPAGTGAQALQDVEDLLARLDKIDSRLRPVVEMKVFDGMTCEETARQRGCSRRTAANCWSWAQRWLREVLAGSRRA